MASAPDTLYITEQEYRKTTRIKPIVQSMDQEAVVDYIVEAMMLIDRKVGTAWVKDDEDQEFAFPRDIDTEDLDSPYIPRGVVMACKLIADALIKKDMGAVNAHEIQSETNAGHSYTKVEQSRAERGFEDIPPRAMAHLAEFCEGGMFFAVSRP